MSYDPFAALLGVEEAQPAATEQQALAMAEHLGFAPAAAACGTDEGCSREVALQEENAEKKPQELYSVEEASTQSHVEQLREALLEDAVATDATDTTIDSSVPLLEHGTLVPAASPRPPPLAQAVPLPPSPGSGGLGSWDRRGGPMCSPPLPQPEDHLPADASEEVSSCAVEAHTAPPPAPPKQAANSSPAVPFVPPVRSADGGRFPRAEAFLASPVELSMPPPEVAESPLQLARWLLGQRRLRAALQALPDAGSALEASSPAEAAMLRLRCLMALRRYDAAEAELARAVVASGVATLPFEARILAAQLPLFASPPDALRAMEQLRELAQEARRGPAGGAGESSQASSGEWLHLLRLLSHACAATGHGNVAIAEIHAALSALGDGHAAEIYVLLGRHHLAEGNLAAAREAFALAVAHGRAEDSRGAHLDEGLLAMAHDQSTEAATHFRAAADSAADEINAITCSLDATAAVVDEAVAAENNLAVCQLHSCNLREGVRRLEAFVRQNPVFFLRDSLSKSLYGLYEFLSDGKERRAMIQELVGAFQLDDMDASA